MLGGRYGCVVVVVVVVVVKVVDVGVVIQLYYLSFLLAGRMEKIETFLLLISKIGWTGFYVFVVAGVRGFC